MSDPNGSGSDVRDRLVSARALRRRNFVEFELAALAGRRVCTLLPQALSLKPTARTNQGPAMAPKADPSEIKVSILYVQSAPPQVPSLARSGPFFSPIASYADQKTHTLHPPAKQIIYLRATGGEVGVSIARATVDGPKRQASRTALLTLLASVGLVCSCAQDRSPRSCKLRSHIERNARVTYEVGIGWERRGVEAVGGERTA